MAAIESISFINPQAELSVKAGLSRPIMSEMTEDLDLKAALGKRIKHLRENILHIEQDDMARDLEVSRGAVGNWELGKGAKLENLQKIANRYRVSLNWLATGVGQPSADGSDSFAATEPAGIRYGGVVEAGAFRVNDSLNQDAELRTIPLQPDPRYPAAGQFAFEVMGDSMTEARMFPGMWVQAVDVHAWERIHGEPGDGRLVIVARSRNGESEQELTVKRLRIFRDRIELQPESANPAHKPITFPNPPREAGPVEARIIAVVISSHWIYT